MPNPRLAARYAKSLIDLSTERNQLEVLYNDMKFLQQVNKASREFVNLLRSPVVKADKKESILKAITAGKISDLTTAFNNAPGYNNSVTLSKYAIEGLLAKAYLYMADQPAGYYISPVPDQHRRCDVLDICFLRFSGSDYSAGQQRKRNKDEAGNCRKV